MKQTAQGLAALGRGPDTQLVHMAPSEVAGLQALAMKHGGSLTINPHTGLPEAGFLSSILPMVIGAGLMAAGVPAPMAGMLVGGGTAVATNSLQKGFMAGLGAYGGAGITEGLMGAGGNALAANAGVGSAGAGSFAEQEAMNAALAQNAAPAVATPVASAITPTPPAGFGGFTPTESAYGAFGEAPIKAAEMVATTTPAPQIDYSNAYAQDAAAQQAAANQVAAAGPMDKLGAGIQSVTASPGAAWNFAKANAMPLGAAGLTALSAMQPDALNAPTPNKGLIRPYTYSREKIPSAFEDVAGAPMSSKERRYFKDAYVPGTPYKAPGAEYMASGGTVEDMSNANAIGANTMFPQSDVHTGAYSSPFQRPEAQNIVADAQDISVDPYTGQEQRTAPAPQAQFADGGSIGGYYYDPATQRYSGGPAMSDYESGNIGGYTYNPTNQQYTRTNVTPEGQARRDAAAAAFAAPAVNTSVDSSYAQGGGISDLGGYSDGGRLLRGPGDGVSDSIPAMIGQKQQARLADGEFVVPARIVSELGNGSTEAGARQLYAMMDRVQKARKKSIGKDRVATDSRAHKLLPA